MSSQTRENESSSQNSDCESQSSQIAHSSHISKKPKQHREDEFRAWNFRFTLETDRSSIQGIDFDAKKGLIAEHLRTRLEHGRPNSILSVTAFCDFKFVLVPPRDGKPSISIPLVGFVQSRNRTVRTMTKWLPDVAWKPVPGGLASDPEFSSFVDLAKCENNPKTRIMLSIFGQLGLNNQGRLLAKNERKVFVIYSQCHGPFFRDNIFCL